jgi:hypothetical protein
MRYLARSAQETSPGGSGYWQRWDLGFVADGTRFLV